jgi:hypothetical protein
MTLVRILYTDRLGALTEGGKTLGVRSFYNVYYVQYTTQAPPPTPPSSFSQLMKIQSQILIIGGSFEDDNPATCSLVGWKREKCVFVFAHSSSIIYGGGINLFRTYSSTNSLHINFYTISIYGVNISSKSRRGAGDGFFMLSVDPDCSFGRHT